MSNARPISKLNSITADSSGNVGIGTSSPTAGGKFDVNGIAYFGTADKLKLYSNNLLQTAGTLDIGTIGSAALIFDTANTERARIDSSGNWYMNSGYGSSAVAYGCRAWVNWQGSTGTVRGSGGVTSVTRNGTSDSTINFNFTMPDANYAATAMTSKPTVSSGSSGLVCIAENNVPTTTTLRVYSNPSNNGAATSDFNFICVSVFR